MSKAMHHRGPLLASLSRMLSVGLAVYLTLRFTDLIRRGALPLLLENQKETWFFALEISLMMLPMLLLFRPWVAENPRALYLSCTSVVLGFVVNRLNVSVTALERAAGRTYIPAWSEVAVTLGIIAAGFAIFRLAALYLPVFEEEGETGDHVVPEAVMAQRTAA